MKIEEFIKSGKVPQHLNAVIEEKWLSIQQTVKEILQENVFFLKEKGDWYLIGN